MIGNCWKAIKNMTATRCGQKIIQRAFMNTTENPEMRDPIIIL